MTLSGSHVRNNVTGRRRNVKLYILVILLLGRYLGEYVLFVYGFKETFQRLLPFPLFRPLVFVYIVNQYLWELIVASLQVREAIYKYFLVLNVNFHFQIVALVSIRANNTFIRNIRTNTVVLYRPLRLFSFRQRTQTAYDCLLVYFEVGVFVAKPSRVYWVRVLKVDDVVENQNTLIAVTYDEIAEIRLTYYSKGSFVYF